MTTQKADEDTKKLGQSYITGGKVKWSHSEKQFWQFCKNLDIQVSYDLEYLWALSQRNEDICSYKTCTQMFMAVLLIVTPKWEQPIHPLWPNDLTNWTNSQQ